MEVEKEDLIYLLDRPLEPVFMPKGGGMICFDVPPSYVHERYQYMDAEILQRAHRMYKNVKKVIKVVEIPSMPALDEIETGMGRHENFSLLFPKHAKLAVKLAHHFLSKKFLFEFLSVAAYARDRINPQLFNYAMCVAMMQRKDTQDTDVPSLLSIFPEKYFHERCIGDVREELCVTQPESRIPMDLGSSAKALKTKSSKDPESRLAYFREDIGVNLHYWHFHLVYPYVGDISAVNKNRRGELFYYMHQQIMARYNVERLCNGLNRMDRLLDWRQPIEQAYSAKLRNYPGRPADLTLKDLYRPEENLQADLVDLQRYADRILDAVYSRIVKGADGREIFLDEVTGIDTLGNIIESNLLSPNRDYYGKIGLSNLGHLFLGLIHDPDHTNSESFGVMSDAATAMRDPVFYRWRSYVNDLFQKYKATLPGYAINQLDYPGVILTDMEVQTEGVENNRLLTYMQQTDVNVSRGMNFESITDPVWMRVTHLDHKPFVYNVHVNNTGSARQGTCRIFMGPKLNERERPMRFAELRHFMIELDKFTVTLKTGYNKITRESVKSSVTIPFMRCFRYDKHRKEEIMTNMKKLEKVQRIYDVFKNRKLKEEITANLKIEEEGEDHFCDCGWPEYMLVPKGTTEGYRMQLFVMISNYEEDAVKKSPLDSTENDPDYHQHQHCKDGVSYCGIRDKKYPDRRPMGYPFDRIPRTGVETVEEFLTPNMRLLDCTVTFTNRTLRPGDRF